MFLSTNSASVIKTLEAYFWAFFIYILFISGVLEQEIANQFLSRMKGNHYGRFRCWWRRVSL